MTTTPRPALTVSPSGERDVVMTRVFNAPRRLVFDAWTTPGLLVRWYGARGWNCRSAKSIFARAARIAT
jgi:uncharacterized protein YndB with AHSA1/START domain